MEATPSRHMAPLSLSGWLQRLESQHPVEIDLGLDRVATVAEKLGLTTSPPSTITVAGTNGKGSVVAVASALLERSGLQVGRYTSPHLNRFNERICINGVEASDEDLVLAFDVIEQARGAISLTYFEAATLAALWIFRKRKVDVQVLEVGLGGRLDAVNILDADVSVITSIGLDHMDWLGDDREQIAIEKAGVARTQRPCVVAEEEPPRSLMASLDERGAANYMVNRDWCIANGVLQLASGNTFRLPDIEGLLPQNIGGAIQALEAGQFCTLSQDLLDQISGLSLPGRLSLHHLGSLEVILDVAHNVEAVAQLVEFLVHRPVSGKTIALFGVMGDKPIRDMIDVCESVFDEWNLIDLSHVPRAMDPDRLAQMLKPKERVGALGSFADLWGPVLARSGAGDRIVVFGSFFSVGEATRLLAGQQGEGSGAR